MPWIESHPDLEHHPKLYKLRELTGWGKSQAIGNLHIIWWWAVKYAEDGDLSKTGLGTVLGGCDSELPVNDVQRALIDAGFLTHDLRVNNWLNRTKKYLTAKYKNSNPKRLKELGIKNKTGLKTGLRQVSRPLVLKERKGKERKGFLIPVMQEVKELFVLKGSTALEADRFFNHYESNGWKVGKNPMKNWRASVAGWILRNDPKAATKASQVIRTKQCYVESCAKLIPENEFYSHMVTHTQKNQSQKENESESFRRT